MFFIKIVGASSQLHEFPHMDQQPPRPSVGASQREQKGTNCEQIDDAKELGEVGAQMMPLRCQGRHRAPRGGSKGGVPSRPPWPDTRPRTGHNSKNREATHQLNCSPPLPSPPPPANGEPGQEGGPGGAAGSAMTVWLPGGLWVTSSEIRRVWWRKMIFREPGISSQWLPGRVGGWGHVPLPFIP